jgi:hypothetical protein
LKAPLEWARYNKVEADLQGIKNLRELQAMGLAVFVERSLDIEKRIVALDAGAGVSKDVEVHAVLGFDAG